MRNGVGSVSLGEAPTYVRFSLSKKKTPAYACIAESGLGEECALKAIPVLSWGCALRFAYTELGPTCSACSNMAS